MKFFDEDGKQMSARDYCDRYYVKRGEKIPPRYQQEIENEIVAEKTAKDQAEATTAEATEEGGD